MDKQHSRLSDSIDIPLTRRRLLGSVFGFLRVRPPIQVDYCAAARSATPYDAGQQAGRSPRRTLGEPLSEERAGPDYRGCQTWPMEQRLSRRSNGSWIHAAW